MIQKTGYSFNSVAKVKAKNVKFGQNNSTSLSPQAQPKQGIGVFPVALIAVGSVAAGVLGHKMYAPPSEKTAQKAGAAISGAAEELLKVEVKDFDKTALHSKFTESKKSIFDFIKDSQEKPEEVKEFLFGVTSHATKSQEFVKEIIADPRKSREITQTLVNKVGGQKNFIDWYFAKDGYQEAYTKHVEKAFAEAKKPDDLFKLSPNWQYYKVAEKFGNDFTAGELPKGFGDVENYRVTVANILGDKEMPQGVQKVKEFPAGLSDKRAFLVEADGKKYVLKVHHDFEEYSPELKASNEALIKNEKTAWLEKHFFRMKENEMMKSDSGFVNAQIDLYLKHNNSPNVANVHFFDNKSKSSLYELAEGEALVEKDANIVALNQKLPDLNNLGIIYNDINLNNFKVSGGSPKIIDSGESSYIDVLRPGCSAYHFKSPNLNGLDLSSCIAGINMDKI